MRRAVGFDADMLNREVTIKLKLLPIDFDEMFVAVVIA